MKPTISELAKKLMSEFAGYNSSEAVKIEATKAASAIVLSAMEKKLVDEPADFDHDHE